MKLRAKKTTWLSTLACITASGFMAESPVHGNPNARPGPLSAASVSANPATAAIHWTPVIMLTTQPPRLFQGSEGKHNLVYDLVLVNYNSHAAKLSQFEVLDDKGNVLKSVAGKDLANIFSSITSAAENELLPGGCGVIFVNLSFEKPEQAPKQLKHKIALDSMNQLDKHDSYVNEGAPLVVDNQKPVVIGPPLKGGRWVVSGGYSGKLGHRRALFPVDNNWKSAQKYAIDWLLLNDKNYSCQGDPTLNTSAPGYGQPVLAVADGTVSGVVEKFLDQPPGKPVGEERLAYPGGNTVILDIGNGHYAFYAHLKPDSIKVKEGQKVKRGEKLAELGNTGNTTGAHLHFHVQDSPAIMSSNGIPYEIESFLVTGEVTNFEQFERNDLAAKPQTIERASDEGTHKNELPKEGTVLSFE